MTNFRPRGILFNMDLIFELLGELVGGVYFGLAELIVPDKTMSKKWRNALHIICTIVMLGSVVLIWAGVIFITDGYGFNTGVIMIAVGGVLVAVHIALAVAVTVLTSKKRREKRGGEKDGD